MWSRNPIAVLHSLGFDQAREPGEWREYLNGCFPWRRDVVKRRSEERRSALSHALQFPDLLTVKQLGGARRELRDIDAERAAA